MEQDINNIVEQMLNTYNKNQVFISRLRSLNISEVVNPYNPEEKLIENILYERNFSLKVAGVDSGFVSTTKFCKYYNHKESGVFFDYQDGELKDYKYFPNMYNLPKPYLSSSSLELEEICGTRLFLA